MTTTWHALLWKEWRERRWLVPPLLVGAIALAPVGLGPAYSELSMRFLAPAVAIAYCVLPLVSLMLGASLAAGENSQHTLPLLQSLPTSMARAALAKLVVAVGVIWLPCIAYLLSARLGPWTLLTTSSEGSLLGYGTACTSLMLWVAASGLNRQDEIRAGAVGLLVVLSYLAVGGTMASALDLEMEGIFGVLFAANPVGIALQGIDDELRVGGMLLNGLVAVAYVLRFGRVAPATRTIEAPGMVKAPATRLKAAWRRPARAILWKQIRDTLPLAALGAGSIFAITLLLCIGLRTDHEALDGTYVANILTATWGMTGFFVAIVAGIGVFMDDLRPELHAFWRSRPIDPDQWFALKFFPALAATILTMALPVLLVLLVLAVLGVSAVFGSGGRDVSLLVLAGYGMPGQSAAFCLAAAAMALFRRPVAAAVAAIVAAVFLAVGAGELGAVAAVPATAAAWLAMRYDWGWNS